MIMQAFEIFPSYSICRDEEAVAQGSFRRKIRGMKRLHLLAGWRRSVLCMYVVYNLVIVCISAAAYYLTGGSRSLAFCKLLPWR
jgi:hypothetical protein